MRRVVRNPLTWMIIAEFIVVTVLVVVAWGAVASALKPALASPPFPPSTAADAGSADSSPLPDVPSTTQPERGPAPGLNLDAGFWRGRLDTLNRDQVFFEQLEWHLIHSAMDSARRYVETIVLPSIERAERPGV
ncbi:MAG: hypothetical protein ACREOM_06580 [Candidatus Dormibacteraceae bacterium]